MRITHTTFYHCVLTLGLERAKKGCADVTSIRYCSPWVQTSDVKYHSAGGMSAVVVMYSV